MANQIRFKRASGSDPGASDLVLGEPAVRTDTGELFFKKDDGSVAKVSGGGITDGDKGDITVSSSGATFTIDNNAVTFAKMQDTAQNRIFGRVASGSGDATTLTASQVRTMINVEDGATADQTASEILTLIKTVDGSGSGLDADTLDGISSASFLRSDADDTLAASLTCRTITPQTDSTFNIGSNSTRFSNIYGDNIYGNGSNLTSLNASNISSGTISDDRLPATISSDITGSAATLTNARSIAGTSFNGSASIDIDYNNLTNLPTIPSNTNQLTNGAGFITATLTNEQVQDIVGGMVSGNTESGISVTYNDSGNKLNFSVSSQTDENFTTTLKNKLDGIASGATNVTNTNQLTNGAGFITATLTNEQVQDIVGAMVSGNSESGITVTYQDGDGTLDFSVASQTDNNFTNADHSKLDGIAAGATNVTNNNQISNGAGYVTSSVINSLNASNLSSGTIPDARFPSTLPAVSGANLTNISATVAGGAVYENAQSITSNYTVTNGKNAMSAGPISIASGVTVTVGSGETYTIV